MVNGLNEAIGRIERRRKHIDVFSSSAEQADELAAQFTTKNVSISHSPLPAGTEEGFVIIREANGQFLGSLGMDTLDEILSPEIHPPWVLAMTETKYDEIFSFLDDTLFSSFDRRQMLATAREIEERAWRVSSGKLYVGFQDEEALRDQEEVYEQLVSRGELSACLYVNADWTIPVSGRLAVKVESADEIGSYWFVVFDGGGSDLEKCGLIAEERIPGQYYGFWTYDPMLVDELASYLESQYGHPEKR